MPGLLYNKLLIKAIIANTTIWFKVYRGSFSGKILPALEEICQFQHGIG